MQVEMNRNDVTEASSFLRIVARFRQDETGTTAIEYGAIATMMAIASIGALTLVSDEIRTNFFDVIAGAFPKN